MTKFTIELRKDTLGLKKPITFQDRKTVSSGQGHLIELLERSIGAPVDFWSDEFLQSLSPGDCEKIYRDVSAYFAKDGFEKRSAHVGDLFDPDP
jgi:hypothetical protein